MPIQLSSADGSQHLTCWLKPTDQRQSFTLKTNFEADNVRIDPNRRLSELYRGNNSTRRPLKLNFYSYDLNPQGKYAVTTLPYMWVNPVDKAVPGIILLHHDRISTDIGWYGRVSYGHKTQNVNYVMKTSKAFYPEKGLAETNYIRVNGKHFFTNAKFERTIRRRWVLEPDNNNKTSIDIVWQNIKLTSDLFDSQTYEYFDPAVWSKGQFFKAGISKYLEKRGTLTNYSWQSGAELGHWNSQGYFGKLSGTFYYRVRTSPKSSLRTTIFGAALLGKVPLQQNY